jgi:hypothetical protein
MLGSSDKNETLSSNKGAGQWTECELCGEERLCTERCDMVTCQRCQVDFLPRKGLL